MIQDRACPNCHGNSTLDIRNLKKYRISQSSAGAVAFDIGVSLAPGQQIKKLEGAGFVGGAAPGSYAAPVACQLQNKIVTLNGAQILLQSVEKRACWSEPLALLASLGRTDALSPTRPGTIYEAGSRTQLLCQNLVGKDQRQVCIERWRAETGDRNICPRGRAKLIRRAQSITKRLDSVNFV